ncbi:MAG: hypothetical protein E7016_04255 [Alphaproteobacteria bacterium]|nr:hypothetical protein [Alphaproteobacteria bacterium]
MNKILLSTLLATTVMFSTVVNAAEPEMAPERAKIEQRAHENRAKKMAEELGLTQEQQEQATAIRKQGQEDIKPLMEEMKALRQKIDEKRKANMEEFEKILTDEQKNKFQEMKEKERANRPELPMRRGMHKADAPKTK